MPKASGLVGSLELSCANADNLTFLSGFLPKHIPLERSARLWRSLPHRMRVQSSASPIGGRRSHELLPPEAASTACLPTAPPPTAAATSTPGLYLSRVSLSFSSQFKPQVL